MQTTIQLFVETAKQNALLTIFLAIIPTATGGIITIFQDWKNQKGEKRKAKRALYSEIRDNLQSYLIDVNTQLTTIRNMKKYGTVLVALDSELGRAEFITEDIDELPQFKIQTYLLRFCELLFDRMKFFSTSDIMTQFYVEYFRKNYVSALDPNQIADTATRHLVRIITPARLLGGEIQTYEERFENYIYGILEDNMQKANLWDIKEKIIDFIKFIEYEIFKLDLGKVRRLQARSKTSKNK